MRLMGSFHTITSQGRSGSVASSPAGRSTSTGAVVVLTPRILPLAAAYAPGSDVAAEPGRAGDLLDGDGEGGQPEGDAVDRGPVVHVPPGLPHDLSKLLVHLRLFPPLLLDDLGPLAVG